MEEEDLTTPETDLIRTETAFSRFPIHRLSKKGSVSIDIEKRSEEGIIETKWEVTYNKKYDQPTPFAYKLDTLVINRKLDEFSEVPELIELGRLSDVARDLGITTSGTNFAKIKKALRQNAGTLIRAKFTYKRKDNTEGEFDHTFSRYGVTFAGEKSPDGRKADAIFIHLTPLYRHIVNTAMKRPLNYDYLKELAPMPQRFYELLSYRMYGALKYKKNVASMKYSNLCTYAPQTRFSKWNQVRAQMHRLHKPHKESGYIRRIKYEKCRDENGNPDWEFIYFPGKKAKEDYLAVNAPKSEKSTKPDYEIGLEIKKLTRINSDPKQLSLLPAKPIPPLVPAVELSFSEKEEILVSKMRKYRVSEKKARELVKSDREAVERELEFFPYRDLGEAIKNPAGLFITAVNERYEPSEAYLQRLESERTNQQAQATEDRTIKRQQFIEECSLCDNAGRRFIKTDKYPTGAMKPCSHDPKEESTFKDA